MKKRINSVTARYYLTLGSICITLQIIIRNFFPAQPVTDFLSGFFIGLGLVFIIAAFSGRLIIGKWLTKNR